MAHPSLVLWNGNNECVWLAEDGGWVEQLGGRPWGARWWDEQLPALSRSSTPTRPTGRVSPLAACGRAPQRPEPRHDAHLGRLEPSSTTTRTGSIDRGSPPSSATRGRRRGRRCRGPSARRADDRLARARTTRRRPTAWASSRGDSPSTCRARGLRRLAVPDAAQPGTRRRPRRGAPALDPGRLLGDDRVAAQRLLAGRCRGRPWTATVDASPCGTPCGAPTRTGC